MSDFTSDFWSMFIAGVTLVGIVACLVLLIVAGKARVLHNKDSTTGHVWDGDLREMNNPLPRWWVGLFVLTVIFSLAYLVIYPGLGKYEGRVKWTSSGAYAQEVKVANAKAAPVYTKYGAMKAEDIAKDPAGLEIAQRVFLNNCAQCHGSDARGAKGFPNLTDSDWLHGGAVENIKETIVKGRQGTMPPMAAAVGTSEDVRNLSQYVLSLSGSPHDSVQAALGKAKFGACAACHGADGKGNASLGAPNLTDDVWLHGYGAEFIVQMINEGKVNTMPAQENRLTPEQIHLLTAYVWNLNKTAKVQ